MEEKMRLDTKAAALAGGFFWGIGLFMLTWWFIWLDGASGEVTLIGKVYRGYHISPLGSFIGLAWGFVDGLIGGGILAWLYNLFARRSLSRA